MSSTTIFHSSFLQLEALQQKPEVVQRGHSKTSYWQYLFFSLSMWLVQEKGKFPVQKTFGFPFIPMIWKDAGPEFTSRQLTQKNTREHGDVDGGKLRRRLTQTKQDLQACLTACECAQACECRTHSCVQVCMQIQLSTRACLSPGNWVKSHSAPFDPKAIWPSVWFNSGLTSVEEPHQAKPRYCQGEIVIRTRLYG